jgi:hypothetical protein
MFCLDGNKFHGDRYTYLLADNWQYTKYDADWTLREKVLVRWMDSFVNIEYILSQWTTSLGSHDSSHPISQFVDF